MKMVKYVLLFGNANWESNSDFSECPYYFRSSHSIIGGCGYYSKIKLSFSRSWNGRINYST